MSETRDGTDPIVDDEIVYRRVPLNTGWYDPAGEQPSSWVAFRPTGQDSTGISIWRSSYVSAQEAALFNAKPGHRYYVFALRVGDLRDAGLTVMASPEEGAVGHASIVELNSIDYGSGRSKKDWIKEKAHHIVQNLVVSVHGPFELE